MSKIETYTNEIYSYKNGYIPLKELNDKEYEKIIKTLGLDINKFYRVVGRFYPFCYANGTVHIDICSICEYELKPIQHTEIVHTKLLQSGNYEVLFQMINKPFRLTWYKLLYDQIPDNKKYDVFVDIYIGCEYGFNMYSSEFIKNIVSHRNKSAISNIEELKGDVITIYRGEGSLSTPYTKAYSWTTDIEVAKFFANRFKAIDGEGQLYRGQVKKVDIIEYLQNRNESEIFTLPENVFSVEKI